MAKNQSKMNLETDDERRQRIYNELVEYELSGNEEAKVNVLIENSKKNPSISDFYFLRRFYGKLPTRIIQEHKELVAGLCMLRSLMFDIESSEYWYNYLVDMMNECPAEEKHSYKSWIAYLDIALPHRGTEHMVKTLLDVFKLMTSKEVTLPEFSVTSNSASLMNGGMDFCEWSTRDKELVAFLGPALGIVLGKYGKGLVDLALAESFFEKGYDDEEVLKKCMSGEKKAKNGGKLEMIFVSVGIRIRMLVIQGRIEEAEKLLEEFRTTVIEKKAINLLSNIDAFTTQLRLYKGDKDYSSWMASLPDEDIEFYTLDRYRFLRKIKVYITQAEYDKANHLIKKMLRYSTTMKRTYFELKLKLLKAIVEFKTGDDRWKERFQDVFNRCEYYNFIRIISEEGAAVLPLMSESFLVTNDEYFKQLLSETKKMAERYPDYLLHFQNV